LQVASANNRNSLTDAMAMGLIRLLSIAFTLVLLSILPLHLSLADEITSIESVPDLQKLMYVAVDGFPCVRLLNLSGEIGCSNPGINKVVAPIIKLKDVKDLVQPHTILVTADEMEDFFTRVSTDLSFASKIGGVLVESGSNFQQKLKGFSPDKRFPQAQFSPYENVEYKWNSAVR
jgi:nicastrin